MRIYLRHFLFLDPCEGFKTWFETSILKGHEPDIDITNHDPELATREVGGVRPNDWYASVVSRPGMYLNSFRDVQVTAPRNTLDTRKRWHVTDNPTAPDARNGGWKEIVWRFDDQVDSDTSTGRGTGFGFLNSLSVNDRIILMARALVCPLFMEIRVLLLTFFRFTVPGMDRLDLQCQDRNLLRLLIFLSVDVYTSGRFSFCHDTVTLSIAFTRL